MRARVNQITLRRLEQLERASTSVRRGGLLIVPRILPPDEWEARALAYYASREEAEALDRCISEDNYERNQQRRDS